VLGGRAPLGPAVGEIKLRMLRIRAIRNIRCRIALLLPALREAWLRYSTAANGPFKFKKAKVFYFYF
jgi:hypothetical protein